MPHFQSPLSTISQSSWWTIQLSLKIPSQLTPQVPQWVPEERGICLQNFLLHFSLKVPSKWAPPSMFPNRVPTEREASPPEPMVYSFIHSFISVWVPNKDPSHKKGENIWSIWSPSNKTHVDGRPTYNGVLPGSPEGLFTTLQSLLQCHAAFSMIPFTLAWVDQNPVSQHVS